MLDFRENLAFKNVSAYTIFDIYIFFFIKVMIFLKKYAIFLRQFRLVYGKKGKTDRKEYINLIDDMCCGFYGIYRI